MTQSMPAAPMLDFPDLRLPLVDRLWPGPSEPATPVVVYAAAAAGLAAAVTVPVDRPGLGWLLAGLGATAAIAITVPRTGSRPLRPWWTLTSLALLAVGAVRASEWLFVLCVLTAAVTASLAVAGGRSVRGLFLGTIAVPIAALRGLPWVGRAVSARWRDRDGSPARLIWSVVVAVALVLVFGGLLAGADERFADLLASVLPTVDGETFWRWVALFSLGGAGTIGACYVLAAPPNADGVATRQRKPLRHLDWLLPVVPLVVLFGAFVAVQIAYVRRTADLSYAEYARSGFWQLSAVTVLTLLVIGVVAGRASRESRADRVRLRVVLGSLAVLTLVIVAAALSRMWAYQQAYGFTVLRVLVTACELWLGVVYLMLIAAGVRLRASWLPVALVSTAVAALLALAVLNPDRFIAERNVDRYQRTGTIDVSYLSTLSADAAPVLARLPEPVRSCAMSGLAHRLAVAGPDDWRAWNLGRSAVVGLGPFLQSVRDPQAC